MIPTKKISLTLIEYAEPLMNELGDGYSQSDLERVLKLATTVWNACILDQWHSTTKHVQALRRQFSNAEDLMPAVIVETLIMRKQQHFGNDPRAITNECIIVKNGEFVVRAEARLDVKNTVAESGWIN